MREIQWDELQNKSITDSFEINGAWNLNLDGIFVDGQRKYGTLRYKDNFGELSLFQ